ncbi:hypothetical protein Tsubulata_030800, partial [Turnera subulata]
LNLVSRVIGQGCKIVLWAMKDEVRKLASTFNLPNKDRKDSQGICFLGKENILVCIEGFGSTQSVNVKVCVYLGPPGMLSKRMLKTMWFSCQETTSQLQTKTYIPGWLIKVRHSPGFYDCTVAIEFGENSCEDVAVVHLSKDDQGLAAGQFAAFYHGIPA